MTTDGDFTRILFNLTVKILGAFGALVKSLKGSEFNNLHAHHAPHFLRLLGKSMLATGTY